MKKIVLWLIYLGLLVVGIFIGVFMDTGDTGRLVSRSNQKKQEGKKMPAGDTAFSGWSKEFSLVEIPSGTDGKMQKAYFYTSRSAEPRPLIVNLHTWSGDYSQEDTLAGLCVAKDLNYIHPDFRGVNRTPDACCSKLALDDIDDAISYAMGNCNVRPSVIYMIGQSGGGYATLAMFMKSRHPVKKFSAWVPISDLAAWYEESRIRGNRYAGDILECTGSVNGLLNERVARERSPLYWNTPVEKTGQTKLFIYAGIYDGIQGSVPITHSINFYNKLLSDLKVSEKDKYVTLEEKAFLLEYRKALGDYGKISDREVFLVKEYGGIKLTIFKGGHDILPEYALDELLL